MGMGVGGRVGVLTGEGVSRGDERGGFPSPRIAISAQFQNCSGIPLPSGGYVCNVVSTIFVRGIHHDDVGAFFQERDSTYVPMDHKGPSPCVSASQMESCSCHIQGTGMSYLSGNATAREPGRLEHYQGVSCDVDIGFLPWAHPP
mmetsp:Transcript_29067/g.67419  ORF Transcript_29067/g.67419 Transcript_29067/m.67419 type:complete len:145 (-) Transcript_29067:537-971(-)